MEETLKKRVISIKNKENGLLEVISISRPFFRLHCINCIILILQAFAVHFPMKNQWLFS